MTHLSIGVIINLEGLSVRHPKGARSIGIGHPRSGDRCTKTLPYPLDPLWVAEQSLQRPRQGVAGLLALPAPHSSLLDEWLRCLSNASPLSRRGEAPEGSSLFRPGVETRSAEDPGKRRRIQGIRPRQGSHSLSQIESATPYRGRDTSPTHPFPGVFGAKPLDTRAKQRAPLSGCHPPMILSINSAVRGLSSVQYFGRCVVR